MTKTQLRKTFYSSIRRGTGAAWIIREAHPELVLTDLVIRACLKHLAYDPQSEGSRAEYLFRLIQADTHPAQIRLAVLNQLAAIVPMDTWDLDQLMNLAVIMNRHGDAEARDVLLTRYAAPKVDDVEVWGDGQIITMDGWAGLVRVAEVRGRRILEEDDWADDGEIRHFQKEHPEIQVEAALEMLAHSNQFIRAYLDDIAGRRTEAPPPGIPERESYESILERVGRRVPYALSSARLDELRDDEFLKLCGDAVLERDPKRLMVFFRLFARRAFALDYRLILARVQQIPEERYSELEAGIAALARFQGDDLRAFALERLSNSEEPAFYLPLLMRNLQPSDTERFTTLFDAATNVHELHDLAGKVLKIAEVNPDAGWTPLLEYLYDRLNCSMCRFDAVSILHGSGLLSERIRAEIPFDCSEEIRNIYTRPLPGS